MYIKFYTTPTEYKIYDTIQGRNVDDNQTEYLAHVRAGGKTTIMIDPSVTDILEVVNNEVCYKADYETTILNKAKASAKATLAINRYTKECSGITFNGAEIQTDRESRANFTAKYALANANALENGAKWKAKNGFVVFTKQNFKDAMSAINTHVDSCFEAEAAKLILIDAATTLTELNAIDLTV